MAVMNREVVGYLQCEDCGTRASLHMTKRGKGRNLYKRCDCGCDQRTGKAVQERWRRDMQPLAGFEDLKVEPMEPIEPSVYAVQEPEPEPELEPEKEPEEASGAGVLGLLVLGVVGCVGLLVKVSRGGA